MATMQEVQFVKCYIRENRQDRLLHELSHPQKRYRGLSRFCHQARDLLDERKIVAEGKDLERQRGFQKFMECINGSVLILSPDEEMDLQEMDLHEALDAALKSTEAMILLGRSCAMVFSEAEKGGRDKFLLFL